MAGKAEPVSPKVAASLGEPMLEGNIGWTRRGVPFWVGLSISCSATFEELFRFVATFSPLSNFSDFLQLFSYLNNFLAFLRTLALIVSTHPYCARKFTFHVMHRALAKC